MFVNVRPATRDKHVKRRSTNSKFIALRPRWVLNIDMHNQMDIFLSSIARLALKWLILIAETYVLKQINTVILMARRFGSRDTMMIIMKQLCNKDRYLPVCTRLTLGRTQL